MFSLACILLVALFVAAIIFRKRFVNAALSFISGTSVKHQGMFDSVPDWAKVLLAERIMNRHSQKNAEQEKKQENNQEAVLIEPEFPPYREEITFEPYEIDHEKFIGSGHCDSKPHGPLLLPPSSDNKGGRNIEDQTQSSKHQEFDNEIVFESAPGERSGGIISFDPEMENEDMEINWSSEDSQSGSMNTEKKETISDHLGDSSGETKSQFDLLLEQHSNQEKESERELAMEKYNQFLNQASRSEQQKTENASNEEESLMARYREFEKAPGIMPEDVQQTQEGRKQPQKEKQSPVDLLEKPLHERNSNSDKLQFNQLLELFNDPEKERERERATQKYYQFLNQASRPEQQESENVSSDEDSLIERYREIEKELNM
ncbi:hypothetical protein Dred_0796 [Desulforamulus reducens MI-1]|uniref:Uncharacterized protein n=1 Tax=Desulforamulus reducens (strain ATCC BAA-1160 / DSM 100696 / MI-1) TaxID=349161 RepID=A4J2N1_DESRM|nr:hypothetical protein [Desulforamulus reducens]ABO49334.1 hypothetical protein Dred_0796 [Desulforamulus reducens MI-1]